MRLQFYQKVLHALCKMYVLVNLLGVSSLYGLYSTRYLRYTHTHKLAYNVYSEWLVSQVNVFVTKSIVFYNSGPTENVLLKKRTMLSMPLFGCLKMWFVGSVLLNPSAHFLFLTTTTTEKREREEEIEREANVKAFTENRIMLWINKWFSHNSNEWGHGSNAVRCGGTFELKLHFNFIIFFCHRLYTCRDLQIRKWM